MFNEDSYYDYLFDKAEAEREESTFDWDALPDDVFRRLESLWSELKEEFVYEAMDIVGIERDYPNAEHFKDTLFDVL